MNTIINYTFTCRNSKEFHSYYRKFRNRDFTGWVSMNGRDFRIICGDFVYERDYKFKDKLIIYIDDKNRHRQNRNFVASCRSLYQMAETKEAAHQEYLDAISFIKED